MPRSKYVNSTFGQLTSIHYGKLTGQNTSFLIVAEITPDTAYCNEMRHTGRIFFFVNCGALIKAILEALGSQRNSGGGSTVQLLTWKKRRCTW